MYKYKEGRIELSNCFVGVSGRLYQTNSKHSVSSMIKTFSNQEEIIPKNLLFQTDDFCIIPRKLQERFNVNVKRNYFTTNVSI